MRLAGRLASAAGRGTRPVLTGWRLTAICAIGLLSLSGCALLPGGPKPLDTYELTAPSAQVTRARGRAQILIVEPSALKSLDGQSIVVKTGPTSIEFLQGAQWSDRLPRIVQAKLIQTFQSSNAFAGVGRPGEGLAIDYQVVAEIRTFDIVANGSTGAEVQFFVRLLNDRSGTVRAQRVFTATAPLAGGSATGIKGGGNAAYANALNRAFGTVADEIVEWVASQT